MIAGLALLLQVAAATPAEPAQLPSLVVRAGQAEATIPLVATDDSPRALRADLLAPALGGRLTPQPSGHYLLALPRVTVDVADRVPFATIGGDVVPLAGAPYAADGVLYLPLQLVTEVLPRYDRTLRYDAARGALLVESPADALARGGDSGARAAPAPAASSPADAATSAPAHTGVRRRRIVVVDAGHGGPDQGMSGPLGSRRKVYEKDVTLAVAKRLRAALVARGMVVVMTRTTDTLVALADRGRIANERHGDLFLSIHVNAANPNWRDPAAARGFETYFLAEAKTEDAKRVERMENESVRFETTANAGRDDPLAFVINDMAQNEHLRESSELAATIQQHLAGVHPGPSRGVKQAGFRVLVSAFMPAVLVEIGFGTNPAEARFISSPAQQKAIASAVADAVVEYLRAYERRVAGGGQ